ncbi:hypothetical protein H4219_004892 [Mycoemilia scoparia]|uniref:Uncharacterized protein n=1 Tax=Mycoemilia scoparia TaxID=417184 RepID=A0A9W7ZY98_9FUNG|nr:hypothetical protein H4219_004892 [Mycoemilia scoparia]
MHKKGFSFGFRSPTFMHKVRTSPSNESDGGYKQKDFNRGGLNSKGNMNRGAQRNTGEPQNMPMNNNISSTISNNASSSIQSEAPYFFRFHGKPPTALFDNSQVGKQYSFKGISVSNAEDGCSPSPAEFKTPSPDKNSQSPTKPPCKDDDSIRDPGFDQFQSDVQIANYYFGPNEVDDPAVIDAEITTTTSTATNTATTENNSQTGIATMGSSISPISSFSSSPSVFDAENLQPDEIRSDANEIQMSSGNAIEQDGLDANTNIQNNQDVFSVLTVADTNSSDISIDSNHAQTTEESVKLLEEIDKQIKDHVGLLDEKLDELQEIGQFLNKRMKETREATLSLLDSAEKDMF